MAVATVELQTITGVEIFRVGKWNGKRFAPADLDALVAAFTEVGFRPPLKLGHSFDSSAPAAGYVTNLRRAGDVLLADFVDMQPEIYDAIKARKYDTVSCEIWFDVDRNQKNYPLLLTAVALLGGDIPAVDLKPLHEVVLEATHTEALVFSFPRTQEAMTMADLKTAEAQAAEVADLTAKLAAAEAKVTAAESKAGEAATFKADLQAVKTELADARKEQARLAEENRKAEIDRKVAACALTALRPYVRALYDATVGGAKKVTFSADGKDPKETDAAAVVDALVAAINAPTRAKLFAEVSTPGEKGAVLPAGASKAEIDGQVTTLVNEFRATHDKVSYTDALDKVLSDPANRELKLAYVAAR